MGDDFDLNLNGKRYGFNEEVDDDLSFYSLPDFMTSANRSKSIGPSDGRNTAPPMLMTPQRSVPNSKKNNNTKKKGPKRWSLKVRRNGKNKNKNEAKDKKQRRTSSMF